LLSSRSLLARGDTDPPSSVSSSNSPERYDELSSMSDRERAELDRLKAILLPPSLSLSALAERDLDDPSFPPSSFPKDELFTIVHLRSLS